MKSYRNQNCGPHSKHIFNFLTLSASKALTMWVSESGPDKSWANQAAYPWPDR